MSISSTFPHELGQVHPAVWRADQLGRPIGETVATGFALLDGELPGHGWAKGWLTEVLVPQHGIGEAQLLVPSLRNAPGAFVFVAPPYAPSAPALAGLGLPLDRLTVVQAARAVDRMWAAEQVLKSGRCAGLVLWCSEVTSEQLRRLQLSGQGQNSLSFIIRHSQQIAQPSPAPLRLSLRPLPGRMLEIHIPKRRGPALSAPIRLQLPKPLPLRSYTVGDRVRIVDSLQALADVVDRSASANAAH